MSKRIAIVMALAAVLALTMTTGCVGKKLYREDMESTNQKISAVESGVEDNERRINDLKSETDSRVAEADAKAERAVEIGNNAMTMAEKAKQAADLAVNGKLLWEVTLTDDRVKFSFGQTEIPGEAAAVLDELIAKVKGYNKGVYVEIEGHTDNIGSADFNVDLGQQRAEAVKRYMNEKGGIPLHAINVISYGEERPVADNSTREGRAQNRRVVVRVLE